MEAVKTPEMVQISSRHTELSDSVSETKSIPSTFSDKNTTTTNTQTTTTSPDHSHSHISLSSLSTPPVGLSDNEPITNVPTENLDIKSKCSLRTNTATVKVSTGVGPSPPRVIPSLNVETNSVKSDMRAVSTGMQTSVSDEKFTNVNNQSGKVVHKTKQVSSTGTSPPPQSISTQVKEI